jgi:hypothetical protein
MRTNIFFIAFGILFSLTSIQAQAWAKDGEFTPGAKIALHRIWGEAMGYSSPEETAKEAKKIYDKAVRENNFVTKKFHNSGVKSDGNINFLKAGFYQGCYLGNIDATFLNGPVWYTVDIYLKKDCMNVDWEFFIAPKEEEKKDPPKVEEKFISGEIILYQWCEEYHWEVTQQATWWLAEVRKEYLNAGYTGVTTNDPALAGSEKVVETRNSRKVYTYTHDPGRRPVRNREVSKVWR